MSRLGIPFRARSRSRVLRLRCLARGLRPNAALVERGLDVLIRMVFLSLIFFAVGVERAPRPNFYFSAINWNGCVKHLNAEDLILRSDGKDSFFRPTLRSSNSQGRWKRNSKACLDIRKHSFSPDDHKERLAYTSF